MSRSLIAVLTLACIVGVVLPLLMRLSREDRRLARAANEAARARVLEERGPALETWLDRLDLDERQKSRASEFVLRLAQALGVGPECLTTERTLSEMLTARVTDEPSARSTARGGAVVGLFADVESTIIGTLRTRRAELRLFAQLDMAHADERARCEKLLSLTIADLAQAIARAVSP